MAKTNTQETAAAVFTKEQLAASKRYANRRDVISALLENGKTYTLNEVDALIENFMKGMVK
jgi:glutamate 5-kinase